MDHGLTRSGSDFGSLDVLDGLVLLLSLEGTSVVGLVLGSSSILLGLLVLGSLDGSSLTHALSDGSWLLTLGNNLFPGDAGNGPLHLDDLAGALLGSFLCGGALLVDASVEDGPVELPWVLLLQKVHGALAGQQAEGLVVTTDKDFTLGWIDAETREITNLDSTRERREK